MRMNPIAPSHKHFSLSRVESVDVTSQVKVAKEKKSVTDLQGSDITVLINYLLKQANNQKRMWIT